VGVQMLRTCVRMRSISDVPSDVAMSQTCHKKVVTKRVDPRCCGGRMRIPNIEGVNEHMYNGMRIKRAPTCEQSGEM
jgi:hypothetical protein